MCPEARVKTFFRAVQFAGFVCCLALGIDAERRMRVMRAESKKTVDYYTKMGWLESGMRSGSREEFIYFFFIDRSFCYFATIQFNSYLPTVLHI
jgi:hypothetical protein